MPMGLNKDGEWAGPPFNPDAPLPPPEPPRPGLSKADQILVDLGSWASAGMDDPTVCNELRDIFARVVDYVVERNLI